MSEKAKNHLKPSSPAFTSAYNGLLQRKCNCGNHTFAGEECAECAKKNSGLQRKITIGASNDPLEQEADRVADQVMTAPTHSAVTGTPLHIQRTAGQAAGQMDAVPASVNNVLASSGKPLESTLRRDMELRFGYDFSRVRVHSGATAEQSAQEVNANAYTVDHNIVFAAGRFAPGTLEGRRLMAHELTHVVQQSGAEGSRVEESNSSPSPIPVSQQAAADSMPIALAGDRTGQKKLQGKTEPGVRIIQRQPQADDKQRCPPGEISLGHGYPCIPMALPGRDCPIGQVRLSPDYPCVPWRSKPALLGGKLHLDPITLPNVPSGGSTSGVSTSGKSARINAMDQKRGCAYTVTYSNLREVDCDTAWKKEKGTNPPGPLCGASAVYDITSVSAIGSKCPKLDGLKVSEVVKGNQGCTPPGTVWAGSTCTIGSGGKISGCTDTFTVCGLTSDLKGDCTEIVDQEIEVGGQLAEEHEIIFDLKKSGKDCTGKVTRN